MSVERNSRPVAGGVRGEPRARQRAPPPRLAATPRRKRGNAPPDTLFAGKGINPQLCINKELQS